MVSVGLVESWEDGLGDLFARIAGRFSRVEPRRRAFAYVRGLLSGLERRNGWTLAEQAGDGSPDGVQALLCSPCWDADMVRDDVRGLDRRARNAGPAQCRFENRLLLQRPRLADQQSLLARCDATVKRLYLYALMWQVRPATGQRFY